MNDNNLGIYVHIPYCIKKCNYCDFNSYSENEIWNIRKNYFDAVKHEISLTSEFVSDKTVDTIYFGGGTPTAVEENYIIQIMSELKTHFDISSNSEITIECNPKTADYSKLLNLRKCGINRISIGLQSIFDGTLKTLGRVHTLKDFEECLNFAKQAGFKNISIDLMFGLPNQTFEQWIQTLEYVKTLDINHISCYCLKIEENTPFYNMSVSVPSDDVSRDMYDICVQKLEKFGFKRYEISNFARSNAISHHNIKYWNCENYIGLGAGSSSYMFNVRYNNKSDVNEYIEFVNKTNSLDYKSLFSGEAVGNKVFENADVLDINDMMSEFVFLGLRKTDGVNIDEFYDKFGIEIESQFGTQILKYKKLNVLLENNRKIYINPEMLYVSNPILADFV